MKDIRHLKGLNFWIAFFKLSDDDKQFNYIGRPYKSNKWHMGAFERSGEWDKCACCQLKDERRKKPKSDKGSWNPINFELDKLGMLFAASIHERKWNSAKRIFNQIQDMVKEENKLAD